MFVEDEQALTDTLIRFFSKEGFDVYISRSRSEAVENAAAFHQMWWFLMSCSMKAPSQNMMVLMSVAGSGKMGILDQSFSSLRAHQSRTNSRDLIRRGRFRNKALFSFGTEGENHCSSKTGGGARSIYKFGDIEVDLDNYVIRQPDAEERLSNREQELLRYLIEHRGKVLPREELLTSIWRYSPNVPHVPWTHYP